MALQIFQLSENPAYVIYQHLHIVKQFLFFFCLKIYFMASIQSGLAYKRFCFSVKFFLINSILFFKSLKSASRKLQYIFRNFQTSSFVIC
jgi:hypothetical protein